MVKAVKCGTGFNSSEKSWKPEKNFDSAENALYVRTELKLLLKRGFF